MKINKESLYRIGIIALIAAYCLHTSSCANTKGAPSGGPRDSIPPVVTRMLPDSNAKDFPLYKGEIAISFNEYVQIKDAQKNLLLSPPQKKPVKTKIKGKSVIVTFQDTLKPNQTYTVYFGQGIVDNNEGNPMFNYTYTFSTGREVDSMMLSGTVMDYATLLPIEGATVALYAHARDSSAIADLPDAVAKSDKWGYFTIRNLKDIPYTVYAFTDENHNNLYDQGVEKVAFIDTAVTPTEVMRKGMPQLAAYDMKDTSKCLARPSEIDLSLYTENTTNQYIRDHKRFSRRGAYIRFNAQDVQIDSFSIRGIREDQIIRQFNITNDSLTFWVNEGGKLEDTLLLGIRYMKTDSTGKLAPAVENLKLIAPFEKKKDRRKDTGRAENEKRKDLLEFELKADKTMVEQEGIVMVFKEPLLEIRKDTMTFKMSTPKKIVSDVEFTLEQDSLNMNRYVIRPVEQFKVGNDYELYFPTATFRDINGFTNDSTVTKIFLPTDDDMSSITLEMQHVDTRYIVELVNETRSNVFRTYHITGDTRLLFPYLRRGKYSVRITEDLNDNGLLDPGNILLRKLPEKVLLYRLPNGDDIIDLPEKTDLEQTVDIAELFNKNN